MNAIIVGVQYNHMQYDVSSSLEELTALCNACNIDVSFQIIQSLNTINPSTFIGKGKTIEIKDMIMIHDIDMVIFDEELSPLQIKNLTDILDVEVTDRIDLILRIFETRAKSKEAKLQVQIAKAKYLLPRLQGMKEHLSHQQGGSGFRGSGEKQIELDRRQIYRSMQQASNELKKIKKQRFNQRRRRKQNDLKVIALVGYTNSGKSTLMNTFVSNDKKVFQKDMLFATLQTSTRHIMIDGHQCLLVDTVGFIDRLPHHLVEAFHATLEEVIEADLLVHVVDSSSEDHIRQIETTNQVLTSLGADNIPTIYAYNKVDLNRYAFISPKDPSVFISAKEGINITELEQLISSYLFKDYVVYQLNIPYSHGEVFSNLTKTCKIIEYQYLEEFIHVIIEAHPSYYHRIKDYIMVN